MRLRVKCFEHEFGTYREVCVTYDADQPAAVDYAFRVEDQAPSVWDARARAELAWYETQARYAARLQRGEITPRSVPLQYRGTEPSLGPLADGLERTPDATTQDVS
jgi:hypothetical protein